MIKTIRTQYIKLFLIAAAWMTSPKDVAAQGLELRNPLRNVSSIEGLVQAFLAAVMRLGAVVVVFMIIYSGFLFVAAQGSDDKLEKAKKTFLWSVIGGVILLSARVLAAVVQNTAAQLGV